MTLSLVFADMSKVTSSPLLTSESLPAPPETETMASVPSTIAALPLLPIVTFFSPVVDLGITAVLFGVSGSVTLSNSEPPTLSAFSSSIPSSSRISGVEEFELIAS